MRVKLRKRSPQKESQDTSGSIHVSVSETPRKQDMATGGNGLFRKSCQKCLRFLFIYVCVCMSVQMDHMCTGARGGRKRVSYALELQLQVVERPPNVSAGNGTKLDL